MESKYRLGVVSVSFRDRTPEEVLKAAKGAGLDCVEWGSDVHAPCRDYERLCEIFGLQEKYGLICSSYGTYFRLGETPMEELNDYINAAKRLGTDVLRLWCGTKSRADMTDAECEALLSACRQAAARAEEQGVVLCMECHRKTFTENPDDTVWLMQAVDSRHFRMYWQPFQWQNVEQNIENAKKIAPYAGYIHVFNWKGSEKLPLGDAIAEWRSYIGAFSTPCTFLLEFMPNGGVEELSVEASALKTIVGETA